jgi:ribonuclease HIII
MFGIIVVIAFQNFFYFEIYQNNILLLFFTSTHQNDLKTSKNNLKQIKKSFFSELFFKPKNKRACNLSGVDPHLVIAVSCLIARNHLLSQTQLHHRHS